MAGVVGFSLASPYLIQYLAPSQYWPASSVVIWISLAYAFYFLNYVLVAGINISGKSYYQMIAIALAAVLNIFLNALLIPSWGITGAAFATTIAYFIQLVLTGMFAQRLYPIPYRFISAAILSGIFMLSYWILNLAPVKPLLVTVGLKLFFLCLVLSTVGIMFFKKEALSILAKIQLVFVSKNSKGI